MGAKNPLALVKRPIDHNLYRAMNEALVLGSVRQHALAVAADLANDRLQKEISERLHAEAEVRLLNAKLEQRVTERTTELEAANHELEAFCYSISHDLRAPLRHISGFVDIVEEDADPGISQKTQRHLNKISAAAHRMLCLVDDLLAFSRLGKAALRKTSVNLDKLVRETLKELHEDTKGRNITWDIHPLPVVQADGDLLRLVLYNLLANAVKFTSKHAEPRIEINCAPGGEEETVIFIRDNGAGFDQAFAHNLFGVFQRLHRETDFPGTGIGLANVQRIIKRHGGRVFADGAVDEGATFYFTLPNQDSAANS